MSKKCLKCGCIISDDVVTGYCFNCSRIVSPRASSSSEDTKEETYDKLVTEEKLLSVVSTILIVLGVMSSIVVLFIMEAGLEAFVIALSTILSSLLVGGFLLCIVEISRNIRVIKSKLSK